MPSYCFTVHENGTGSDNLGSMRLADDAQARAFGKKVIRDLMRGDAALYAGWTMNITEGDRAVDNIPFDRTDNS